LYGFGDAVAQGNRKPSNNITMTVKAKKQFTAAEVAAVERGDCEWVDFVGLKEKFSIKRSLGYALAAEGKIHSVSLRHRNRTRGKRLFSVDSVRAYLAQCSNSNGNT
jgi:hypothetical protein